MHAPSWPTSFGLRVTSRTPRATIEDAWREYACGKPAGDGKRSYRYGKAAVERPDFRWVNTILGNIKNALRGTYHAIRPKLRNQIPRTSVSVRQFPTPSISIVHSSGCGTYEFPQDTCIVRFLALSSVPNSLKNCLSGGRDMAKATRSRHPVTRSPIFLFHSEKQQVDSRMFSKFRLERAVERLYVNGAVNPPCNTVVCLAVGRRWYGSLVATAR